MTETIQSKAESASNSEPQNIAITFQEAWEKLGSENKSLWAKSMAYADFATVKAIKTIGINIGNELGFSGIKGGSENRWRAAKDGVKTGLAIGSLMSLGGTMFHLGYSMYGTLQTIKGIRNGGGKQFQSLFSNLKSNDVIIRNKAIEGLLTGFGVGIVSLISRQIGLPEAGILAQSATTLGTTFAKRYFDANANNETNLDDKTRVSIESLTRLNSFLNGLGAGRTLGSYVNVLTHLDNYIATGHRIADFTQSELAHLYDIYNNLSKIDQLRLDGLSEGLEYMIKFHSNSDTNKPDMMNHPVADINHKPDIATNPVKFNLDHMGDLKIVNANVSVLDSRVPFSIENSEIGQGTHITIGNEGFTIRSLSPSSLAIPATTPNALAIYASNSGLIENPHDHIAFIPHHISRRTGMPIEYQAIVLSPDKPAIDYVQTGAENPTPIVTEPEIYKVISGDTLGRIASKHGITLKEILQYNPQIKNPNLIRVGEQIALGVPKHNEPVVAQENVDPSDFHSPLEIVPKEIYNKDGRLIRYLPETDNYNPVLAEIKIPNEIHKYVTNIIGEQPDNKIYTLSQQYSSTCSGHALATVISDLLNMRAGNKNPEYIDLTLLGYIASKISGQSFLKREKSDFTSIWDPKTKQMIPLKEDPTKYNVRNAVLDMAEYGSKPNTRFYDGFLGIHHEGKYLLKIPDYKYMAAGEPNEYIKAHQSEMADEIIKTIKEKAGPQVRMIVQPFVISPKTNPYSPIAEGGSPHAMIVIGVNPEDKIIYVREPNILDHWPTGWNGLQGVKPYGKGVFGIPLNNAHNLANLQNFVRVMSNIPLNN